MVLICATQPGRAQTKDWQSAYQEALETRKKNDRAFELNQIAQDARYQAPEIALRAGQSAAKAALKGKDLRAEARAMVNIANCWIDRAQYTTAIACLDTAGSLYQLANHHSGVGIVLYNIGNCYYYQSEYQQALAYYRQAEWYDLHPTYKPEDHALTLKQIGNTYEELSYPDSAIQSYEQAYLIFDSLNNEQGKVDVGLNMGILYRQIRHFEAAERNYQAYLKYYQVQGNRKKVAIGLNNLANLYEQMADTAKSKTLNLRALKLRQDLNDQLGLSSSHLNLAILYEKQGRRDSAFFHAEQAVAIGGRIQAKEEGVRAGLVLSNLHLNNQEPRVAISYLQTIQSVTQQMEKPFLEKEVALLLAHAHNATGNETAAQANALAVEKLNQAIFDTITQQALVRELMAFDTQGKERQIGHLKADVAQVAAEKEALRLQHEIATAELDKKAAESRAYYLGLLTTLVIIAAGILSFLLWNRSRKLRLLRAEVELRSKALLEGERNERRRTAQELHDGLGQTLASIRLKVAPSQGDKMGYLLDQASKELRAIAHDLSPDLVAQQGLFAALQMMAGRMESNRTEVQLVLMGQDNGLTETVQHNAFRMVQELLHNINKHAHASEVTLQAIVEPKSLQIMVEDNGQGFDPQAIKDGIGLTNLKSRVDLLKGELTIDATLGHGTSVLINIPLI